jgi:FkbM family methyltransferase
MPITQYPSLITSLAKAKNLSTLFFCAKSLVKRRLFGTYKHKYQAGTKILSFRDIKFLAYEDLFGIYKEIYSARYLTAFESFLPKAGDIIFDVGAGEGFYSILMKQMNPEITVYAFEPFSDVAVLMGEHFKINEITGVKVVNKALFDCDASGYYVFRHDYGNGYVSLQKPDIGKDSELDVFQSDFIRLGTFVSQNNIKTINILKIDVEGAELGVLKGAGKFLNRVEKIVLEYHSPQLRQEVFEYLKTFGFRRLDLKRLTPIRSIDYYIRQENSSSAS